MQLFFRAAEYTSLVFDCLQLSSGAESEHKPAFLLFYQLFSQEENMTILGSIIVSVASGVASAVVSKVLDD